MNARNWTVNSYDNDTWKDLVTSPMKLDCLIIAIR